MISSICSLPRNEVKGKMFWNFLSMYEMDIKPRNTKIVKMKQNDVKIKLDSTGNVTGEQV